MPPDGNFGSFRDLLQTLLHTVLAEVLLAREAGLADGGDGKGFGDGYEPDGGGGAPGSLRRRVYTAADVEEPGGDAIDRGTCCSYFFTMACSAGRDALTSAAFGPLGSTFR